MPQPLPNRPARVLLVNRVGHLGGVERIILTLASSLSDQGWEPILACPPGELEDAAHQQSLRVLRCTFDRMRVTRDISVLARYPGAFLRASKDIFDACVANNIRLIHVHHPVTALYACWAARRLRIPMLLHVHEAPPAHIPYKVSLFLAGLVTAASLCVSKAAMHLAADCGVAPRKLSVVPNGVDAQFFTRAAPAWPPEVARFRAGTHVGIFGVLEPRKAQHVLLQAVNALSAAHPDLHVWIVGRAALADKAGYEDHLRLITRKNGIEDRVHFVGYQANPAPWLAAMHVVVQTSVAGESFGMAIAEAMSLGKPVVVSRTGGLPEVVLHDRTGIVVTPEDPAALAHALDALLSDHARRTTLAEAASRSARERFAPATFAGAVARHYDALAGAG